MSEDDKKMRAEEDKDEPKSPDQADKKAEEEEDKGAEPSYACKNCGMANEKNAKYCDQCGESMEAAPLEDEDEEEDKRAEEDEDEEEDRMDAPDGDRPDSTMPPPPPGNPPKKAQPPPPEQDRSRATLASILGLRKNSSALAVKSAVLGLRAAVDQCMKITGTNSLDNMVGAVMAHASDAQRLATVEEKNRALTKASAYRERMDLLRKLSAAGLPGYTRGELFVDHVDEKTEERTVRPSPVYAEMKLGTLRGLVKAKLSSAPAKSAKVQSPFAPAQPDTSLITNASGVSAAKVQETAQKFNFDPKAVEASYNALFGNK